MGFKEDTVLPGVILAVLAGRLRIFLRAHQDKN